MGRSKSRGWVSRIASIGFVLLLLGPARGADVDTLAGLMPGETFPAAVAGTNVPTYHNRAVGGVENVDKLDVTMTATVDFNDKVAGDAEVIFESGGSGTGFACVYEAGNVVSVIKSGGGNLRAAFALPQSLVDGGEVSLAWTCNPDSPQGERSVGLIIQGF
ncbi:MAG: hypothetical protein O7J95_05985, partial [Planctomycetota bacterium]|nr:hypothetical protein [Planctomycetota bacterium]